MGAGLASAQQPDGTVGYCGNADSLAAFHAPKLFFAPGERFFPTLPFVSAFDGVDNDSDGVVDLEDLDEIAPLDSLGRVDLDRLNRWAGRDSRHAVLYRVRPLAVDDRRRLDRFLRADQQAWLRYGMDSVAAYLYDSMQVIEYYLFFTHDEGLEGHLLDTEKLFVFVPCSDRGRESLRVIVGSAHDVDVPNNVLVLAGTAAAVATVYALVELGGHAVAPDVDPYGSIRLGWDFELAPGTRRMGRA